MPDERMEKPAATDADLVRPEMTGTDSQLQWADQIRPRVAQEFDRVSRALQTVAATQPEQDRAETLALIAILEEKRAEIMANDRAGYFIRDWQELDGRVRQTILQDPRYKAICAGREVRRRQATASRSAAAVEK